MSSNVKSAIGVLIAVLAAVIFGILVDRGLIAQPTAELGADAIERILREVEEAPGAPEGTPADSDVPAVDEAPVVAPAPTGVPDGP